MARLSSVQKNERRRLLSKKAINKRRQLKQIVMNRDLPFEERISATLKLAEMPRNSSETRIRNRCHLSGRPRGFHRKFGLSRIALREFGSLGLIPGLVKSSW